MRARSAQWLRPTLRQRLRSRARGHDYQESSDNTLQNTHSGISIQRVTIVALSHVSVANPRRQLTVQGGQRVLENSGKDRKIQEMVTAAAEMQLFAADGNFE
jgi:hypothetical protein